MCSCELSPMSQVDVAIHANGMAEKVRDGIDGFYFSDGNPIALASLVKRLVEDKSLLTDLAGSLPGEPGLVSGLDEYMGVYRGLAE